MKHNLSLADETFKAAFVSGEFFVDCVAIKLTRNGPGSPAGYSAPGALAVTPARGATTRLVVPRDASNPYDPLAFFKESQSLTLGQIVPDHNYFALEATDTAGNVWKHAVAQACVVEETPAATVLTVECALLRLETTLEKPEPGATAMVFMEELSFPDRPSIPPKSLKAAKRPAKASSKASVGMVSGLAVTFDHRRDRPGPRFYELFAENEDSVALDPGFDDRLLEGTRFVTATIATPVMRETILGQKRVVELARIRPSNKGDLIQPPLFVHGHEAEFHRLFERYFEYSRNNAQGEDYAPLSAKISGIFALEGVFVDTVALLLAVTVESILGDDHFSSLGKPEADMSVQVDMLIAQARSVVGVSPKLIERGISAIGSMKSTRAVDKLQALVAAGLIDDADRATWKKLRDSTAHGSFEIDPAQLQKLYDGVYRVSTLAYKLAFLQIGYEGKFSNRAVVGWPIHHFPPGPAAPPSASASPAAPGA
ncbi:hypothetical protein QTH97_33650 [Variovorax sp. J22R24]|uniref:hypothetical protein n=1 Tax=Variovorax gracilis TaxID=3053502 RepID=UPI0025782B6B|nr:hypothetical protein [Variovorax sp. J22R24]MDM0109898.1 hypothetical protein [Variovorax sp. J22R24]